LQLINQRTSENGRLMETRATLKTGFVV